MLFALVCTDRPAALDLRLATRAVHLAYIESSTVTLVQAGAMLDAADRPCGSLFVIEAEDRAAVEAFAAADPYAKAGLFESTVIRPYRCVFKDGARV